MISLQDTSKALRSISDPTRLRLLRLLSREELSVAELQRILGLGQSTVSTHLAHLREAGLIADRKDGTRTYYSRAASATAVARVFDELAPTLDDTEEARADLAGLHEVLEARQEETRAYFDRIADAIEHEYLPGRTWEGLAKALFQLLPRHTVADLGIGSGELTLLLCQSSAQVIGVDYSKAMLDRVRQKADRAQVNNLDLRQGEIESLPLQDGEVDLVVLSQALHHATDPQCALAEAHRVLRPGGKVVILDLAQHRERWVQDKFQDRWLGFLERDLRGWLEAAGFADVVTSVVARERQPPHFQTVLATGVRAGTGGPNGKHS